MKVPTRFTDAAAANNAHWCDLVCRTHGLHPRFDIDIWTSPTRTPLHYPDAVTLEPDVSIARLLSRIDVSAGCSVKDSFASLDLTSYGFRVLFEGEWIARTPQTMQPAAVGPRWEIVRDPAEFVIWDRARRADGPPSGVLHADLISHDEVTVLAGYEGDRLVAGAVLNRTSEVVGISNFFAPPGMASASWAGCVGFASTLFPGSTLVGYRTGPGSGRTPGFDSAGPLLVWVYG